MRSELIIFACFLLFSSFVRGQEELKGKCYDSEKCKVDFRSEFENCAGRYCGRPYNPLTGQVTSSACGACDRGSRTDHWVCLPCTETISAYAICYLVFIVMFAFCCQVLLAILYLKNNNRTATFIAIPIELVVSMILAVLCFEPLGSLKIYSCMATDPSPLADWYTLSHSPSNNSCGSEAVYPMWTLVMVFYAFCALVPLIVRTVCILIVGDEKGYSSLYHPLYLYPFLVIAQAIIGGLIYFSFPYIVLVVMFVLQIACYNTLEERAFNYPDFLFLVLGYTMSVFAIISIKFFFGTSWLLLIAAFLGPAVLPAILYIDHRRKY
eukprot:TRINITY_DN14032_c1_g1_i1.p1 TRINITY_DN14032_c1_g1~~TRINITY_DN14032_c1_g1_i1.p1  ORF type:complete len:323 (-),score=68.71 TRINITY_DN14032_c1_g1_i1:77-1045(-)